MIIPVGYGQVNLRFTGSALPNGAEITFGFQNVAATTPDVVAGIIDGLWGTLTMGSLYAGDVTLSSIRVKHGPNASGPDFELPVDWDGTASGESSAPNTAALIKKHTALGGRKHAGRMFQPGIPEVEISAAGLLDGGVATSMQSDWQAFLTGMDAADVPLALLHSDATAPDLILGLTVDSLVATQRRRLRP